MIAFIITISIHIARNPLAKKFTITITENDCFSSRCANLTNVVVTSSDNVWSCSKFVGFTTSTPFDVTDSDLLAGECTTIDPASITTQINSGRYVINVFELDANGSLIKQFRPALSHTVVQASVNILSNKRFSLILHSPPECLTFRLWFRELATSNQSQMESKALFSASTTSTFNDLGEEDLAIDENISFAEWLKNFALASHVGVICDGKTTLYQVEILSFVEPREVVMAQYRDNTDAQILTAGGDNTAMVTYDVTNQKLTLTTISTLSFADCLSIGYNIFMKANDADPVLIHGEILQTLIMTNRVLDIRGMQVLNTDLVLSIPTSAQINTFFIGIATKIEVGFQCIIDGVRKIYPLTTLTTKKATITLVDAFLTNTITIKFSSSANKINVTFIQPTSFSNCAQFQLYMINNVGLKLQHVYNFTKIPTVGTIFDLRAMVLYDGISTRYLDAATIATFWTSFIDGMVGFQCIVGGVLKTKDFSIISIIDTAITAKDTNIVSPAIVVFDPSSEKIIITSLTASKPTGCSGDYKIIFGDDVTLIHGSTMTSTPSTGLVYDINYMSKLGTSITNALESDITLFKTTFVTDKKVGFVCSSDVKKVIRVAATIILTSVPLSLIDSYVDNSAVISYDPINQKLTLSTVQIEQMDECAAVGYNIYMRAKTVDPTFVYGEVLQTMIVTNKVLDIRAMMIQNAQLVLAKPSSAQITSFFAGIPTKLEVGFQCIASNAFLKTNQLIIRVSLLKTSIKSIDLYMTNTVGVKYDIVSSKIALLFIQTTPAAVPACQSYYLYIQGNNIDPKLQYYIPTAMPTVETVFDTRAMVQTEGNNYNYVDASSMTMFWKNFITNPQVGFQCFENGTTKATSLRVYSIIEANITAVDPTVDPSIVIYDKVSQKIIISVFNAQKPVDCINNYTLTFGEKRLAYQYQLDTAPPLGFVFGYKYFQQLVGYQDYRHGLQHLLQQIPIDKYDLHDFDYYYVNTHWQALTIYCKVTQGINATLDNMLDQIKNQNISQYISQFTYPATIISATINVPDSYLDNSATIQYDQERGRITVTTMQLTKQFSECSSFRLSMNLFISYQQIYNLNITTTNFMNTLDLTNEVFYVGAMRNVSGNNIGSVVNANQIIDYLKYPPLLGFWCATGNFQLNVRENPVAANLFDTFPNIDNTANLAYDRGQSKLSLRMIHGVTVPECASFQFYIYNTYMGYPVTFVYQYLFTSIPSNDVVFNMRLMKSQTIWQIKFNQTYYDPNRNANDSFWDRLSSARVGFMCAAASKEISIWNIYQDSISADDSNYNSSATVVFDQGTQSLLISLSSSYAAPSCNTGFKMTIGDNPMLAYFCTKAKISDFGSAIQIINLRELKTPLQLVSNADISLFTAQLTHLNNIQVGLICAENYAQGTFVTATVVTAKINATYDNIISATMYADASLKLINVTINEKIPPCDGTIQLTSGTNLTTLIHIYPYKIFPMNQINYFLFDNFQQLNTNGTITEANNSTLQILLNSTQIGFVCSTDFTKVYRISTISKKAYYFRKEDVGKDAAYNNTIITFDKVNNKLTIQFLPSDKPKCNYKITLGTSPRYIHPRVISSWELPASDLVFSLVNMKSYNVTDKSQSDLTDQEITLFSDNIAGANSIGVICQADQTLRTYPIIYTKQQKIDNNDTYTPPVAPPATENKVAYNNGSLDVGVVGIGGGTSKQTTFKSNNKGTTTSVKFIVGDVIKMSVVIIDLRASLTPNSPFETEPTEFIASAGNTAGGMLSAKVQVTPKEDDKTVLSAVFASGLYKTTVKIIQNNAQDSISVEVVQEFELSTAAIAGIAIGAITVFVWIAVVILYLIRKRAQKIMTKNVYVAEAINITGVVENRIQ